MRVNPVEYNRFIAAMGYPPPRHMFTGRPSCPTSQTVEHVGLYGHAIETKTFKRGKQVGEPSLEIFPNSFYVDQLA